MAILRWAVRAAAVAALPALVRWVSRQRAKPRDAPRPATKVPASSTARSQDSPNQAEQLQGSHAMGAYGGIAQSLPAQGADAALFPKMAAGRNVPSGDGSDGDPTPGLPDFARGA